MRNPNARVSDPNAWYSNPGSRIHLIYGSRFNGARLTVEVVGQEDLQDRINAYAPYCDLYYMLQRLSVGDRSVLSRSQPMYGDFSGLPDNPVDAINLYHDAERTFAQLDTEAKQQYNNDFRVWLSQIMTAPVAGEQDVSRETSKKEEKAVES